MNTKIQYKLIYNRKPVTGSFETNTVKNKDSFSANAILKLLRQWLTHSMPKFNPMCVLDAEFTVSVGAHITAPVKTMGMNIFEPDEIMKFPEVAVQ